MNKKNISLYIGVAIPVIMIIAVALFVYVPTRNINPHHDFLYSLGGDMYYDPFYSVKEGKIVLIESEADRTRAPKPTIPYPALELYIYFVADDVAKKVELSEVANLKLDSSLISPDGYDVDFGRRVEGIFPLFWGSSQDYETLYIYGDRASKKLNVKFRDRYYNNNFRFVGWVIE